jgi:hypothetical protein
MMVVALLLLFCVLVKGCSHVAWNIDVQKFLTALVFLSACVSVHVSVRVCVHVSVKVCMTICTNELFLYFLYEHYL